MKDFCRNKGSLTIEAALVVPIFAFAILSIALFMKVIYVQEVMQKSISDAANQIAQYAYIYNVSGFKEVSDKTKGEVDAGAVQAEDHKAKIIEALGSLNKINSESSEISPDNIKKIQDDINSLGYSEKDMEHIFNDVKADPKAEAISFICLAGKAMIKEGNKETTKLITILILKNSLKTKTKDADERLKSLYVEENSLWNFDFQGSSLFMDKERRNVDIVVTYNVKIPIPFGLMPKFKITQRASTLAWLGSQK